MTTMLDVVTLIVGNPTNDYQTDMLYLFALSLGIIMTLFFLKIFTLIAGYIPNR